MTRVDFSDKRYFLYGSFWSLTRNGIRIALSLIAIPISIGYLGNQKYGLWMTVLSIASFSSFLDFGITPLLLNRMAESFSKNDDDRFKRYFSSGLFLGFCILGFGIILALLAPLIAWESLFDVKYPRATEETRLLVSLLLFLSFGSVGLAIVENFFNSRLQVLKPQVCGTLANIIGFGLLLLSIRLNFSLPILAFFNLCPVFFYRFVLLLEIVIKDRSLIILKYKEMSLILKELLPTSLHFMGIQFAAVILLSAPNVIIAKILGMGAVTTFSVSYKIYNMPLMFLAAIFPIFWPAFTIAWGKKENDWLKRSLFRAIYLTVFILVFYVVLVMVFGKSIVKILTLGNVFPSNKLMLFLGIWMVVQAVVNWLSTFLHSITDFRFEFLSYSSSAVMLALTAIVLAKSEGLVGIAIAMGGTLILGSLIPMWIRTQRKLLSKSIIR